MGACSCKGSKNETTDLAVDTENGITKQNSQNGKFLRIKSLRVKEEVNNIQKIEEILQSHDKPEDININTTENTKKKDESLVLDYEISQDEMNLIRQSLSKHFLFKDMDEELM